MIAALDVIRIGVSCYCRQRFSALDVCFVMGLVYLVDLIINCVDESFCAAINVSQQLNMLWGVYCNNLLISWDSSVLGYYQSLVFVWLVQF